MKFDEDIFSMSNPWFVGETALSFVVLNFDQTYPGRTILVPKGEAKDIESLSHGDLGPLMQEVARLGGYIKNEFNAARMNYASLGNVVDQLHWHLIPRYESDPNWGAPPWPISQPKRPSDDERQQLILRIQPAIRELR